MTEFSSSSSISTWLRETPVLTLEERDLLVFLLTDSQALGSSLISARFTNAEQEILSNPLPCAWPFLSGAYLFYARVLRSLHLGCTLEADQESNLCHANSALIASRSLIITKIEEAELCLTQGVAFALSVYATIGVGISDICHYCLNAARSFIETSTTSLEIRSQKHLLVLLETMDCIAHRRKPTIRSNSGISGEVDRRLGLSLPLLPFYHDICIISNSLDARPGAIPIYLLHRLQDIEEYVIRWQPSLPVGSIQDFRLLEVVQFLAQARAYRLGALMMIHRLRYVFGQEDGQAGIWSQEVMRELELCEQMSDELVRFVTLPFIIAAVETRSPADRNTVIQNVDRYV